MFWITSTTYFPGFLMRMPPLPFSKTSAFSPTALAIAASTCFWNGAAPCLPQRVCDVGTVPNLWHRPWTGGWVTGGCVVVGVTVVGGVFPVGDCPPHVNSTAASPQGASSRKNEVTERTLAKRPPSTLRPRGGWMKTIDLSRQ